MNNNVMKSKNMIKSGVKKLKEHRRMLTCAIFYGMMQANEMICYAKTTPKPTTAKAKDTSVVTDGLVQLKLLVITIIGAIGVIYAAKSVMEFASAYQQSDSSGMNNAAKGIAGGLMMAGISTLLGVLGIS